MAREALVYVKGGRILNYFTKTWLMVTLQAYQLKGLMLTETMNRKIVHGFLWENRQKTEEHQKAIKKEKATIFFFEGQ